MPRAPEAPARRRGVKILLGGVPLGCDNIGDEAILAGVCGMLRESLPGVSLTVCTADPGTADLLGVETAPLFGFGALAGRKARAAFAALARCHDAYVWFGATGLSDYPATGLGLLETAQAAGVPTFVWGVGMDDELNPVFFRASGRRKALLGAFGLVGAYERRLRARLSRRLAATLPKCGGVWLRDPESAAALAAAGFGNARVAADSAILLARDAAPARPAAAGRKPVLGLCFSAQRQIADFDGARALVDAVRAAGFGLLGIPMNPKTDRAPLEALGVGCISGTSPAAVMDAAAGCGAVLSSRLHLLILAAAAGTPGLGIARGSKVANWLANFGEKPLGNVKDCDWKAATGAVLHTLRERGDWDARRAAVFAKLRARLETARAEFVSALAASRKR